MSSSPLPELARPVASSSRHTLPAAPSSRSPPSRRLPRFVRRHLNRSFFSLLLAFSLPIIAAANPVPPNLTGSHRSRRHLDDIPTGPVLDMGSWDPTIQTWRVPDGYVRLKEHFNGGFIVLSYAIAVVGSLCTLELLIRRTTNSGWRNQLLLTSAGFCFGAVSTFAMHFVFNNALSLHHPAEDQANYPPLYLSYDPGFTILSLVVSCLAMTMAFFVMGTQLKDWLVLPGQTKGRSQKDGGESKAEPDDYGKWKKQHKKIVRRGTMGVGALFAHASHAAKWSHVDLDGRKEKMGSKGEARNHGVQGMYSPVSDGDDRILGDDEALNELDFRLGKDAVRVELERRAGASTSVLQGNHGPILTPLPIIYTGGSSRRESAASGSTDVFAASFNFPPRTEQDTVPTGLSVNPSRASSPPFIEPLPSYQPDRRRASLPCNTLMTHRERPSYSGPSSTLARIQSLPEGDLEPNALSSQASQAGASIDGKTSGHDPSPISIAARLGSFSSKHGRTRKVRLQEQSTRWVRLGMFLGLDVVTVTEVVKICITGTIAGCGVAGMHYIGQASITGMPYVAYKASYVVGSIIIACGAVMIALYIMFIMLRPKLKHTWISKICVALILAVAVTCMHFCGTMGTIYAWPSHRRINRHTKLTGTNVVITGIVAALAFTACIACAVFFVLHSLNQRRERARRRRVVVAAVLLDDRDRVLVNSIDGMLPMCDIASLTGGDTIDNAKSLNHSLSSDSTVLGMDLSTSHDAFISALKLSWTWKNPSHAPISPVTSADARGPTSEAGWAAALADIRRGSMITDNTTTASRGTRPSVSLNKFLERFTLSSCQLAVRLLGQADGISRLGVLYDQILTTGWVKLHNSNDTVSKGQLIFLVRRVVSAAERADLELRHFIFADPHSVASALHRTLSVPFEHTMPLLDDMRTFCDSTLRSTLQPGKLYAGVAVVQATPFDGLRILLEKDKRSQLPMREMCALGVPSADETALTGSVEEIGEALALLEGMTILSVISRNMTFDTNQLLSKRVVLLLTALERAIVPMLDEMLTAEDMEHILPRLTLHPMMIPLTPGGSKKAVNSYIPPYAIVFYANYDAAVNTFTDKWLPFSLFRAQNACVMAPKITAAAKMDQLYTAESSGENTESATYNNNYRRPSKVQFDFPPSREPTPLPSPVTEREETSTSTSMFSGFTFPPKAKEETAADSNTNTNTNTKSTSVLHRAGSSRGIPGASAGPAVGRRSSLARSRFGSTGGDSTAPSAEGSYGYGGFGYREPPMIKTASTGVAVWEQDWLLQLLRMKLRADA